jgi:hypothetical protein
MQFGVTTAPQDVFVTGSVVGISACRHMFEIESRKPHS